MKVTTTLLGPSGSIPNNPTLPLLHYHGVVDVVAGADAPHAFEALFESHGWSGSWRNGIMGFHHYHTSAHEVLGIYSGSATVQFGGKTGIRVDAVAGDVIVVPAGVGHKRLSTSGSLGVVGAYPDGQTPDLCQGSFGATHHEGAVAAVALPRLDPVCGENGPMHTHWSATQTAPY